MQLLHEALTCPDENDCLADIARRALLWTRASGAAIALESGGEFVCRASAGDTAPAKGATLDRESGFSGLCVRTGSVLICEDAEADPRVSKEACRNLGVRSILAIPVDSRNRSGVLEVFSREPDAFDDHAVAVLRDLSEAITATLDPAATAGQGADTGDPLFSEAKVEAQEPNRLHAYAIAACSAVLVGTLAPAAVMLRENLRLPPPPPVAVMPAPDLSRAGWFGSVAQQAEGPQLKPTANRADKRNLQGRSPLGEADRQYRLATAFAEGRGVRQNLVEAYAWFVIAGVNGNRNAEAMIRSLTARMPESDIAEVRFRLGDIFQNGFGVPKDFVESYCWYALAEAGGHPRAAAEEHRLANAMTPEQVAKAKNRAAKWLAEHKLPKGQNG